MMEPLKPERATSSNPDLLASNGATNITTNNNERANNNMDLTSASSSASSSSSSTQQPISAAESEADTVTVDEKRGKIVLLLKNLEFAPEEEIREFLLHPADIERCIKTDEGFWYILFHTESACRDALDGIKRRVLRESKPYPKLLTMKQLPRRLTKPTSPTTQSQSSGAAASSSAAVAAPDGCGIWNRVGSPGSKSPEPFVPPSKAERSPHLSPATAGNGDNDKAFEPPPEWDSMVAAQRGKFRNAAGASGLLPVAPTIHPDGSKGFVGTGRGRPIPPAAVKKPDDDIP